MSDPTPDNTQPPAAPNTPPPGAYPPPPAYSEQPPAAQAYPGQPAYPAAPGYTPYPAGPKTNVLAIISLIASIANFVILPFVGAVAGVITGHISLKQLKTSGENGRGMALAGTIIGWVGVALSIIGIILAIIWFAWFATMVQQGDFRYDYS